MKIYLSGPIDNCTHSEKTMWRHMIKQIHPNYEYVDPLHYEVDVLRGKKTFSQLIALEKRDIESVDVLLAYPWKPGSGTAMEIMYAYMFNQCYRMDSNQIKIISVIEKDKYLSPWIRHHSHVVVDDFHGAFQWIENNMRVRV